MGGVLDFFKEDGMIKFTLIFIVITIIYNLFVRFLWYPYYEDEIKRHCLGLKRNYKAMLPLFIVVLLDFASVIFGAITIVSIIIQFL